MGRAINNYRWLIAVIAMMLTACASDNIHQLKPESIPEPQRFEGILWSSVPIFPTFEAVPNDNFIVLTWQNESQSMASLLIGPFDIYIAEMNMNISIGQMVIEGVHCLKSDDGSFELSLNNFECQAGQYYTTGSLTGTLTDGNLNLEIQYRPGSMPFTVLSVFSQF